MTVAAFDLGQRIGWVKGGIVGPLEHGSHPMPNTTNLGEWLAGSDVLFRKVLPGVTAIAVEQPFLGSSYWPARKLISLLGHLHYTAKFYGVGGKQINEVPVATGKLNLSGSGKADADQMIAAALERYDMELDEHEAHALGIWDVHIFGRTKGKRPSRVKSSRGRVLNPHAQNDGEKIG